MGTTESAAPVAARPLRADAARNRELLLRAAEEVFSSLGLDAGVDEVARRAGVGMGTLYRRFPTKEALVTELAQHLFDELSAAAATALESPAGTAVSTFLTLAGEQFARHGGLLTRLWCVPRRAEEIAALRARFAAIVAADQTAGTVRPEIVSADMSVQLYALQGVVESAGSQSLAAVRRHIDLALAGMSVGQRPLTSSPLSRHQLDRIQRDRLATSG